MFSRLKVPYLCAAEDTNIILPSPVELAVSSREGSSSRVSRKWLKWFTLRKGGGGDRFCEDRIINKCKKH